MQKLLISFLCCASLALSGCSSRTSSIDDKHSVLDRWTIIHKPEIQQGNIITQEMVNKLRPGMDKRQVRFIMGTPLLVDVFHQDRWDYFYSLQQTRRPRTEERLSVYFEDNRLVRIEGDRRPQPEESVAPAPEVVVSVPDYEPETGIISRIMRMFSSSRE